MASYRTPLDPATFTFPDPVITRADGLLAMGGDLSPARLFEAYYRGIFPWYDEGLPILWHCPNPRGVLLLDQLHVPRRLERDLARFVYTINRDFPAVINSCATIHDENHGGTWILPEMIDAYITLHHGGIAHSVEVWREDELVGGIYGVAMGGIFAAESKFHRVTNASKAALVHLGRHLQKQGFAAMDTQLPTTHLATFGVKAMPRSRYLQLLAEHRDRDCPFLPA
ncbi:MAG: leucyl/phenylalanyl-tRNA--protein transferase [Candidatus Sumerlaeia bacterium]|nr:leucyl/phenylalanyl-tRNA--protein transferase [Candidatus Sumerlaeia bacterium]